MQNELQVHYDTFLFTYFFTFIYGYSFTSANAPTSACHRRSRS